MGDVLEQSVPSSTVFIWSLVVQSLSRAQLCDPMDCSTPSFPVLHYRLSLLKLLSIESLTPSNHLSLCRPLSLLPSIFPGIRVFSNESALRISWPQYQLQHQSFQWILKTDFFYDSLVWSPRNPTDSHCLLKHYSSKASILPCSAFFLVQLSHPYMTAGKTIALTIWTFVSKVMSLLFNTLSRFVIAFLPRSKRLSISSRARIRSLVYLTPNPIIGINTVSPWGFPGGSVVKNMPANLSPG